MLPKEIKRFEMENLAMESQLPIIQYVLNPGKQVSSVTSNPFFFLTFFSSGYTQSLFYQGTDKEIFPKPPRGPYN